MSNVRETPRISVNKLAEYLVATPARRRGIIRDQKIKRDFIVARYQSVYAGVAECLATGDVSVIYTKLEQLYEATPTSTWELQDNQLSVEALELFASFVDEIDLARFRVVRPGQVLPRMNVSGTEVSVKPCVILRNDEGTETVGAVHVYISKLFSFGDDAAAYATITVHQYVEDVLGSRNASPADSFVIDVFARRVHSGPRAIQTSSK
jgi:hypothetical protein